MFRRDISKTGKCKQNSALPRKKYPPMDAEMDKGPLFGLQQWHVETPNISQVPYVPTHRKEEQGAPPPLVQRPLVVHNTEQPRSAFHNPQPPNSPNLRSNGFWQKNAICTHTIQNSRGLHLAITQLAEAPSSAAMGSGQAAGGPGGGRGAGAFHLGGRGGRRCRGAGRLQELELRALVVVLAEGERVGVRRGRRSGHLHRRAGDGRRRSRRSRMTGTPQ